MERMKFRVDVELLDVININELYLLEKLDYDFLIVFSNRISTMLDSLGYCLLYTSSAPAAQIRLIKGVVIVRAVHPCVSHIVISDIRVIIGHVKYAVLPEAFSPAVLTDECAVSGHRPGEILRRIIIVPAYDDHIVIAVSYTHLDVYKRQPLMSLQSKPVKLIL